MKKKKDKELSALGRAGGQKTLKKHGKKHFSKIAFARWQKEKEQTK